MASSDRLCSGQSRTPVRLLMGFLSDALTGTILSPGLDREQEVCTVRAFNKLLWLQNDLINRHYQGTQESSRLAG